MIESPEMVIVGDREDKCPNLDLDGNLLDLDGNIES